MNDLELLQCRATSAFETFAPFCGYKHNGKALGCHLPHWCRATDTPHRTVATSGGSRLRSRQPRQEEVYLVAATPWSRCDDLRYVALVSEGYGSPAASGKLLYNRQTTASTKVACQNLEISARAPRQISTDSQPVPNTGPVRESAQALHKQIFFNKTQESPNLTKPLQTLGI